VNTKEKVKEEVNRNSDLVVIPGGFTKLLQALHVVAGHSRSLSGSFTTSRRQPQSMYRHNSEDVDVCLVVSHVDL
jgi:hypothetical protein